MRQLASQTAQVLNITTAARAIGMEKSTAENYAKLLEAVFLVQQLPAWGRTLASGVTAAPKIHGHKRPADWSALARGRICHERREQMRSHDIPGDRHRAGANGAKGALAIGALATGAAAIGALAIGRLRIRRATIRSLDVGELRVGKLHVNELTVVDRREL